MSKGIFGFVKVAGNAVETHRDSYLLDNLSVVSVRRPLLSPCLMISGAFTAFGLSFADLLWFGEILTLIICISGSIALGWQLGQLKLLSRDLRGSELSDVIWGRYSSLQEIRADIIAALHHKKSISLSIDNGAAQ